jgi:hypothetical protein
VSALLRDLGVTLVPQKLAASVAALDADSSGALSFEEFLPWWNAIKATDKSTSSSSKIEPLLQRQLSSPRLSRQKSPGKKALTAVEQVPDWHIHELRRLH